MDDTIDSSVVVRVDRAELLHAIRTDCVTILSFYLGDELTLEVPEFHQEIWQELLVYLEEVRNPRFMIGVLKKLFCVPRDHAKSTLSKLAVILFMRYSPFKFCVYASNTINVALQAIKDIIKWLDSEQDLALYGPHPTHIKWIEKSNESQGLFILHINTPEYGLKRIILKALGADSQVRGTLIENQRPQFMVIDDCEDLNTASSENTQARLDAWMLGSLLKALSKKALILMLGNMISEKTLIARLSKEPDWNPTVFGAIVREKNSRNLIPLWPGRHTLDSLVKEYKAYRRLGRGHIWAHEMMNLTSEKVFGLDMSKAIQIPMPNPDMISAGCIVLDPAFGINNANDESAITVHVMIKNGHYGHGLPHIVDSISGRFTEIELLEHLVRFSCYWGINTWCIEAVAGAKLYMPLFRTMLILQKMPPENFTFLPITGGNKVGGKASRIAAFRNAVSCGSYGIAESQDVLFNKLLSYNPDSSDHDDLEDSGSMGMIAWDLYGSMIESKGVTNVAMSLFGQESSWSGLSQLDVSPM